MTETEGAPRSLPQFVVTPLCIAGVVGAALVTFRVDCDSAGVFILLAFFAFTLAVFGEAIVCRVRGGTLREAAAWAAVTAFVMFVAIVMTFWFSIGGKGCLS